MRMTVLLCVFGVLLATGFCSAEAAEMSAIQLAMLAPAPEMSAIQPATLTPAPSTTTSGVADLDAFLATLGGPPLTPNLFECTNFTCNRPKDCFLQGYNQFCDPLAGTAAWCFGYPGVTNCEGECGCL